MDKNTTDTENTMNIDFYETERTFDRDFAGGNFKNDYCIIYLLKNKITNDPYVGQSWYPLNIRMGKNGENYSHSIHLYNAIKKYGVENFEYEVLNHCFSQEEADLLEVYYIREYDSIDNGYNIKEGGSRGLHSDGSKKRISETQKKLFADMTNEELAYRVRGINGWWTGKTRGPQTEERKAKKAAEMTAWHAENEHPMKGKHHSEKSRKAIAEANRGPNLNKRKPHPVAQTLSQELQMNICVKYDVDKIRVCDLAKEYSVSAKVITLALQRNGVWKSARQTKNTENTHKVDSNG